MNEQIWQQCWCEDSWFDFTQESWLTLPITEKEKNAKSYQDWYAEHYNVFPETKIKNIPVQLIPPGKFLFGTSASEQKYSWNDDVNQKEILIEKPFWLATTPVTQKQWLEAMSISPCYFKNAGNDAPMENISWGQAMEFCTKIGARLPTEEEWEYACRAGTLAMTYAGDFVIEEYCNAPELSKIAWYAGNSSANYEGAWLTDDWHEQEINSSSSGTQIVARKKPNAWGLFDMIGNVWEWTNTLHDDNKRKSYILKGASWFDSARNCRSGNRYHYVSSHRSGMLGFRACFDFLPK